ncbi:unnamed protein product [Cutaneotrichosporon oleaginosum]
MAQPTPNSQPPPPPRRDPPARNHDDDDGGEHETEGLLFRFPFRNVVEPWPEVRYAHANVNDEFVNDSRKNSIIMNKAAPSRWRRYIAPPLPPLPLHLQDLGQYTDLIEEEWSLEYLDFLQQDTAYKNCEQAWRVRNDNPVPRTHPCESCGERLTRRQAFRVGCHGVPGTSCAECVALKTGSTCSLCRETLTKKACREIGGADMKAKVIDILSTYVDREIRVAETLLERYRPDDPMYMVYFEKYTAKKYEMEELIKKVRDAELPENPGFNEQLGKRRWLR